MLVCIPIEREMGHIAKQNLLRGCRIVLKHFKSPYSEAMLLGKVKRL